MARRLILLVTGLSFLMLLFTSAALANVKEKPRAVQGVLDTSQYDYTRNGIIELNGEWEFYWSELLTPESFHGASRENTRYIQVPKTWKNGQLGDLQMSNFGYATYRLIVRMDSESAERQMAVYMPSVATSYKLWIDGRLRAENGIIGTNREEMVPKNYRKVVYFEPGGKDVEIVIQTANFVQRKGGLWEEIRLGTAKLSTTTMDRSGWRAGRIKAARFILRCRLR